MINLGDVYFYFEFTVFSLFQYLQVMRDWFAKIVSVLLDNRLHPIIKDSNGETEYSTQYKLTVKITTSLLEFGRNIEQSTMVTILPIEFPST